MSKKLFSERDICTKYVTPALENAGWDRMKQFREEVNFTDGRIDDFRQFAAGLLFGADGLVKTQRINDFIACETVNVETFFVIKDDFLCRRVKV